MTTTPEIELAIAATDTFSGAVRAVADAIQASAVVAALEAAWNDIRANHPELPAVFVITGSGAGTRGRMTWGHFAAVRWGDSDGNRLHELFVSGEGMARGAEETLGTLLHEAAHCIAHVREIKDTSNGGRYHNTRFAKLARELGIEPEKVKTLGWSPCTMTDETRQKYAATITALAEALKVHRTADSTGGGKSSSGKNMSPAQCQCGRKIRVTASVLDEAPIVCSACEKPFIIPDEEV